MLYLVNNCKFGCRGSELESDQIHHMKSFKNTTNLFFYFFMFALGLMSPGGSLTPLWSSKPELMTSMTSRRSSLASASSSASETEAASPNLEFETTTRRTSPKRRKEEHFNLTHFSLTCNKLLFHVTNPPTNMGGHSKNGCSRQLSLLWRQKNRLRSGNLPLPLNHVDNLARINCNNDTTASFKNLFRSLWSYRILNGLKVTSTEQTWTNRLALSGDVEPNPGPTPSSLHVVTLNCRGLNNIDKLRMLLIKLLRWSLLYICFRKR